MFSPIREKYSTLVLPFPFNIFDTKSERISDRNSSSTIGSIAASIDTANTKPQCETQEQEYAYTLTQFLAGSPIQPTRREYSKLKELHQTQHVLKFGAVEANKPGNQSLNRYSNIYPYDYNRIKLQGKRLSTNCDYFNGSYITGSKSQTVPYKATPRNNKFDRANFFNINFLAAQGPLPHTCNDLWQVVYENQVDIIVMVTKLIEGKDGPSMGTEKCEQYWPTLSKRKLPFGQFEVSLLEENQLRPEVTKRIFTIEDTISHGFKVLTQIQYVGWPDYGVPEKDDHIIKLVKDVREIIHEDDRGEQKFNVLVHCSAGVGRTGTFVALYRLMDKIEEELFDTERIGSNCGSKSAEDHSINIFKTVFSLRSKRVEMVQSWEQYKYLYASVAAYAKQLNGELKLIN